MIADVAAEPFARCDQWADVDGCGRRCVLDSLHDGDHLAFGRQLKPIRWPRLKRFPETFQGDVSAKRSEERRGEETPLTPLPSGERGSARADQNQTQQQSWEGAAPW